MEGEHGATRPINPHQAGEYTPVEIGRVVYTQEAIREAQAAARAPVPSYMQPDELDPRAYSNLDEQFPDEATFMRWVEANNASAETIAKIETIVRSRGPRLSKRLPYGGLLAAGRPHAPGARA